MAAYPGKYMPYKRQLEEHGSHGSLYIGPSCSCLVSVAATLGPAPWSVQQYALLAAMMVNGSPVVQCSITQDVSQQPMGKTLHSHQLCEQSVPSAYMLAEAIQNAAGLWS